MQALVDNLPVFLLIVARVSGIFMSAPAIGSRNLHPRARVGASVALALLIAPFVPVDPAALPADLLVYVGIALKELIVGILLGFSAMLIFNAVQLAGQVLDVQIGFGVANVIDPITNAQVPTMGQFQFIIAMLLFLAMDGHHLLLTALARSFELVPLTEFWFSPTLASKFSSLVGEMFVMAVKVGAPAIGALFLAEMGLGMIARTVPQMNVFIVGIPLKIALSFVVVLTALPIFQLLMANAFGGMMRDLLEMARAMGTHG